MEEQSPQELGSIIVRVQQLLRDHLNANGLQDAAVSHFGSVNIAPKYLAYCIQVKTDREAKEADRESLTNLVRTWLKEEGYPATAADQIAVRIDSEETVLRDYDGNWYHYCK